MPSSRRMTSLELALLATDTPPSVVSAGCWSEGPDGAAAATATLPLLDVEFEADAFADEALLVVLEAEDELPVDAAELFVVLAAME